MFSDTHFHFSTINNAELQLNTLNYFEKNFPLFALDIGTRPTDLPSRAAYLQKMLITLPPTLQEKVNKALYFSAGVWPDIEELQDVNKSIEELKKSIASPLPYFLHNKVIAIGECGLDHHYNLLGADKRDSKDFNNKMLENEEALFTRQLDLATSLSLPVIVHSREAGEETIRVLKTKNCTGIIHCFSYGVKEAKAFLDLGFYISFSGSVTYTKRKKEGKMRELLNFLPRDRILCETDSPFLAPATHRGKTNCPIYVSEVYNYIAQRIGLEEEKLSEIVEENIRRLFKVSF